MPKKTNHKAPPKKKSRLPGRPKKKHAGGRPLKYQKEYNEIVFLACKKYPYTDKQLSELLAVSESTLNQWKHDYPKFSECLKKGKAEYDNKVVVSALHERAVGYSHDEDKIFLHEGKPVIVSTTKHYPPETAAIKAWLYNRDPENWKEKTEIKHSGNIGIGAMKDDELDKELSDLEEGG